MIPDLSQRVFCDEFVHQPGGGHDHPGAGALGVELSGSGGGIGIGGRIFQNLTADNAAVFCLNGNRYIGSTVGGQIG